MARTAVATDSNSGITQKEAKELGIRDLCASNAVFYQRKASF